MAPLEGFEEQEGPEFEEKYRQHIMNVEEELRKIGLYMDGAAVSPAPEQFQEEGKTKVLVTVVAKVGDVAWSDRVLRPEVHKAENEWKGMTVGLEDDMDEMLAERLKGLARGETPVVEEPDDSGDSRDD